MSDHARSNTTGQVQVSELATAYLAFLVACDLRGQWDARRRLTREDASALRDALLDTLPEDTRRRVLSIAT